VSNAPIVKKEFMLIGIMLIIIGLVLIDFMFNLRSNMPFKGNELSFLFIGLLSTGIIIFGGLIFGTGFGARFPLKAFLIAIAMLGVWMFLIVLPIMASSLPEEVSVLALSFSGLLFVLAICFFEKWSKKRKEKRESLFNWKPTVVEKQRILFGATLIITGLIIIILNPFTDFLLFALIGLLSVSIMITGVHMIGSTIDKAAKRSQNTPKI